MGHTLDLSLHIFSFISVWSKTGLKHISMTVSHPACSLCCHYSGNKQSCQSGTLYQFGEHLKMYKQQQDRETSFSIYLPDRMGDAPFISVSNMHFTTLSWRFYVYYDRFAIFIKERKV